MRRRRRAALGAALTALASLALARADRASIAVVGSVNVDVIARVASHPRRGETRAATSARVERACGGKGANQAVAASRLTCERGAAGGVRGTIRGGRGRGRRCDARCGERRTCRGASRWREGAASRREWGS